MRSYYLPKPIKVYILDAFPVNLISLFAPLSRVNIFGIPPVFVPYINLIWPTHMRNLFGLLGNLVCDHTLGAYKTDKYCKVNTYIWIKTPLVRDAYFPQSHVCLFAFSFTLMSIVLFSKYFIHSCIHLSSTPITLVFCIPTLD